MTADEPAPSSTESTDIPFSFSALKPFDIETVPVRRQMFSGLVSVPPGQHPLEELLGQPCGDPVCPYRCHALELHPNPPSMLKNYIEAARAAGLPAELVLDGLARDVYTVSTAEPGLLTADLTSHPINWRIPVTFSKLRRDRSSALSWEVTRIIRDHYGSGAILLAPGRHRGHDVLIHAQEGRDLTIEYRGALAEVLPILASDPVESRISRMLGRLLGASRENQLGDFDDPRI